MRRLAVILLVVAALTGCSSRGARLRVGVIRPSLNHLPLLAAIELGYIGEDDIELIPLATGWETGEALAAGRLDMAIMPFTYAWRNAASDGPVRIVSFLERESNGLLARPGVDSLRALDGARVGVLRASTLELLAEMTCVDTGLRFALTALRSPGEMIAALRSGEVDAISFYTPPILSEGRAPVLWYGELYPMHPCCDVAAHSEALTSRSEDVRNLLRALDRAIEWMDEHPQQTAALAAERYGLAPQEAAAALRHVHYRTGLDEDGRDFERRAAALLYEKGELERLDGFEIHHAIR